MSLRLGIFAGWCLVNICWCELLSASAATTRYRRQDGLSNRNLFSYRSGSWKSEIRCQQPSGSGEGCLPDLHVAAFSHGWAGRKRERELENSIHSFCLSFSFFMAAPVVHGGSPARDSIQAAAMTDTIAVPMPAPLTPCTGPRMALAPLQQPALLHLDPSSTAPQQECLPPISL